MDMVKETKNYKMFLSAKRHFKYDPEHLEEVKESVKKNGLKVPILVDDHMVIIDGLYRFRACEELGIPVQYSLVRSGFTGITFEEK